MKRRRAAMGSASDFDTDSDEETVSKSIAMLMHHAMVTNIINCAVRDRDSFRKRWDSPYLVDLAQKENSFVSEYRMTAERFNLLHEMLEPILQKDEKMQKVRSCASGSAPISTASRFGIGMIKLGGGRLSEAMRTHGVAKSTGHDIFHQFVRAVNECPGLEVKHCDPKNIHHLRALAAGFKKRSEHDLFEYCIYAILF